jgi:hypothetical protein
MLVSEGAIVSDFWIGGISRSVGVHDRFCSDGKVTAALRLCAVAVGETWVANKPGGLNVRNSDDLETPSAVQSLSGPMREADLSEGLGEGR